MSENDEKKAPSTRLAISKNSKILALFAIGCTALVGLVNELTKDKIKVQEQQQLLRTLHSIIEPERYDNNIANDCIMVSSPLLGSDELKTAYIARKQDQVVALAMTTTAPNGYNGNIELIVGINIDGTVNGVRVLKHQETPGLGDKIEIAKSDWITSFNGQSLLSDDDSRWAVVKDNGMFDQFTGATITPRAIVNAVKDTLSYFNSHQESLFMRPNACSADASAPVNADKIANVTKTNKETSNEH